MCVLDGRRRGAGAGRRTPFWSNRGEHGSETCGRSGRGSEVCAFVLSARSERSAQPPLYLQKVNVLPREGISDNSTLIAGPLVCTLEVHSCTNSSHRKQVPRVELRAPTFGTLPACRVTK